MACYDCGLEYGGIGWIEAIIPDKAWDAIRPEGCGEGAGILCINCMSKRLAEKGFEGIPVWFCGCEPLKAVSGEANADLLRNWLPGQMQGGDAKDV